MKIYSRYHFNPSQSFVLTMSRLYGVLGSHRDENIERQVPKWNHTLGSHFRRESYQSWLLVLRHRLFLS